jgi:hypothetical protein
VTCICDGKITRIEQYGSKAEALEAAGLREWRPHRLDPPGLG